MNSSCPSKKTKSPSSSSLAVGIGGRFFWDGSDDVTLDDWMEFIKPSLLSTNDCAWIQVESSDEKYKTDAKSSACSDSNPEWSFSSKEYQPALDKISQLVNSGNRVPSSAKNECVQSLVETAKKQRCTVGKWILFVPPTQADETWDKVARATISGQLGSSAKIAPAKNKYDDVVCCIYVEDFSCRHDVQRVLKGLFDLGFKVKSGFKPDFYTYLGIYAKNKWRLSPVLYSVKETLSWDLFPDEEGRN